jgi:hypothetical protein
MQQKAWFTHSRVTKAMRSCHISLVKANNFVVFEKFVFICCQWRYGSLEIALHVFNIEHVRDQLLVFAHLNETFGDHREVFRLYVLPANNLQIL